MRKPWPARVAFYAAVLAMGLYMTAPFMWLIISSFQTEREIVSVPPHWIPTQPTLENYVALFDPPKTDADRAKLPEQGGFVPASARDLMPSMRNSLVTALVVAAMNVALGCLAAYAFARLRFRGKRFLSLAILGLRIVPDVALVIPFFLLIRNAGLIDSPLSLILTYMGMTLPFSVFILTGFLATIPKELDEAAMVDGAGSWQVLMRIILPIASPGLIAAAVFSFMASWNEFLFALIFTKTAKSMTLPVIVATFTSDFNISFSLMNAAGVLAVIPPVLLALFFRRYLVDGLTRGAVKG